MDIAEHTHPLIIIIWFTATPDWFVLLLSILVCCQPIELIWAFLFHKLSNFTPPPQKEGKEVGPMALDYKNVLKRKNVNIGAFTLEEFQDNVKKAYGGVYHSWTRTFTLCSLKFDSGFWIFLIH